MLKTSSLLSSLLLFISKNCSFFKSDKKLIRVEYPLSEIFGYQIYFRFHIVDYRLLAQASSFEHPESKVLNITGQKKNSDFAFSNQGCSLYNFMQEEIPLYFLKKVDQAELNLEVWGLVLVFNFSICQGFVKETLKAIFIFSKTFLCAPSGRQSWANGF